MIIHVLIGTRSRGSAEFWVLRNSAALPVFILTPDSIIPLDVTLTPVGPLRPLLLCDRKVLPERGRLSEADFILLAGSIQSRRRQHHFLLTAWVLLPDHWHAIFMSPYPSTMSHPTDSSWVATVHFFLIFDLTRLEISARLEAYTAGV